MVTDLPSDHVTYSAPPVVEVVLAAAFHPIQRLGIVGLVEIWQEYFRDLSEVEEQPRLQPAIEQFEWVDTPAISFEVLPVTPLPRLWFHNLEGTQLVQVQNNWFARNWRKLDTTEDYPLYPAQRSAFETDLAHLADYIRTKGLGDIVHTQCEVTYINHVQASDVAAVLTLIDPGARGDLPPTEATSYASQFVIERDGEMIGRLHVQAVSARNKVSGAPLVVLTITARGRPVGEGLDGVFAFLDLGREWCDKAFDSLTRPEMQAVWGRHDGR
jgi:uncharacterized protein (TIGR04255 family)